MKDLNHGSVALNVNIDSVDAIINRRKHLWDSENTFILCIEFLLLIFPMYIKWSPTLEKRHGWGLYWALAVSCGVLLDTAFSIWLTWLDVQELESRSIKYPGMILYYCNIAYMMAICLVRLVSVYYFYDNFRWPWYHGLDLESLSNHQNGCFHQYLMRTLGNSVLVVLLIVTFTFIYIDGVTYKTPYWALYAVSHSVLVLWPLDLHLCSLCLVYLKYHLLLHEITQSIKNGYCSFACALEQYRSLYRDYIKKDCPLLSRGTVQSYLILLLCALWLLIYDLIHVEGSQTDFNPPGALAMSSVGICSLFALYSYFASMLSETFMEFESVLIEQSEITDKDYSAYNHLMNFTARNALIANVGSTVITKMNILKTVLWFLLSQAVAHAVRRLL